MRIGLQTWGSEGDIRPFVALADGLNEAGHEVTLVITSVEHKDYAHWPIHWALKSGRLVFSPTIGKNSGGKYRG